METITSLACLTESRQPSLRKTALELKSVHSAGSRGLSTQVTCWHERQWQKAWSQQRWL